MSEDRDARSRWEALFESTADAILVSDFDSGRILEANPTACGMLGFTLEEFRTKTGRMLSPDEEGDKVSIIARGIIEKGQGWHPQLKMRRKDGSEFWSETRCSVYSVEGRKSYVAVFRDVTERVDHGAELQQSYDQLQSAHEELRKAQAQLVHSGKLVALEVINGFGVIVNQEEDIVLNFGFQIAVISRDRHAIERNEGKFQFHS